MIVSAGREIRERERRLSSIVRGSEGPSRLFFCIFSKEKKIRAKKHNQKKVPRSRHSFLSFFPPTKEYTDRRFRTRASRSSGTFSFSFSSSSSSSRFPTHPRKLVVDLFFFFFFFPTSNVQKMRARQYERGGGRCAHERARIAYRRKTVHPHFSHAQSALMMTMTMMCALFFTTQVKTYREVEHFG